jgi:CMP-N-acetylneuraminic acid synthetase
MKFENCYFLIPARRNSKGFPFKNRKLFKHTVKVFPDNLKQRVYVSTDDEVIKKIATEHKINVLHRPEKLGRDETSMKEVLQHFKHSLKNAEKDTNIVLLYLTYPQRTWQDIEDIYTYFLSKDEKSLVCCEDVKEHPYLCFYDEANEKASMLVDHKLYRRQDYPKCLKLSMFVGCYSIDIIDNLHDLMFEKNSIFYKLQNHKVDVDYLEQYLTIDEVNQ